MGIHTVERMTIGMKQFLFSSLIEQAKTVTKKQSLFRTVPHKHDSLLLNPFLIIFFLKNLLMR